MSEVTIKELEDDIVVKQVHVDRAAMATKLAGNREFKKLILEDFCINECARYAQMSADPNLTKDERADALAIAQAAGHLRRYLAVIHAMGNTALKSIGDTKDEIESIRSEGEDE